MKNKVLCLELNDKKEMATAHAQLQEQGSRTLEYGQKNGDVYILLAEGPHFDLDLYDDYSIIDDPHPDLLASYFRLPSPSIEKNLCILKSSSMTQIFQTMNFLLHKHSYSGIEIYRATNSCPMAIALLCNGKESFDLPKEYDNVNYKVIDQLNDFVHEEFF